jgi:ferrous iron transport protein B
MDTIKIVLAGQPNVGKSMLINSMSSSNSFKVGNFSGVTVEKSEVCFEHHCHIFEIVDLPGTYSLNGYSKEEKVARDYLLNSEYDVIVNVLDSTKLRRNLLLTLELLSLNKKMVLALNMADEAKKEGIEIDVAQLEKIIGIPVVLVSANTKEGIDELLDTIHDIADSKKRVSSNIIYSDALEEEILNIENFLESKNFRYKDLSNREVAIELIFGGDEVLYRYFKSSQEISELKSILENSLRHLYTHHETNSIEEVINNEYNAIARGISLEIVKYKDGNKLNNLTKQIDNILIHKYFGIPIFLFLMWTLFQLTFTLGAIPMEFINGLTSMFGSFVGEYISNSFIRSVIVDGVIAGVGAVLSFLPNIVILYFGIALLETTGYMSRVAFLLDGFFHKFGLHGKSFIPLVTGFGCSVPAYMAARTLKSEKDRLITLFIIGFMSCGARLPIYILFTGAFFSQDVAGNVLFLIYISGAILGLIMAKFLRVLVFKGEDEPFVMEMPKYRFPSFNLIFHTVYNNAKGYVKKAGTFILGASILIWVLANFPIDKTLKESYSLKIEQTNDIDLIKSLESELRVKELENSFLGEIGKFSEPLFKPLGFDWKMVVALESGLAAKEVVISTLGVLYSVADDREDSSALANVLRENISFASAMAFIVFVMIYLPCLAASMVFVKEAGGYRYLFYLFIFTTLTAWIFSFITYRVALILS